VGTDGSYTLPLSLIGKLRVIWQSFDNWQQTARPLLTEADTSASQESSFTWGYREKVARRPITVRAGGVVQVPRKLQHR
jgi:hypothetical protein